MLSVLTNGHFLFASRNIRDCSFSYASHVRWSWWSRESRLGYSTFNREEETASTKVQMQRKPNHLATFHMSAIKACAIVARAMPFNWLTSKISYLERTRLSIPQQSHLSDSHTHTHSHAHGDQTKRYPDHLMVAYCCCKPKTVPALRIALPIKTTIVSASLFKKLFKCGFVFDTHDVTSNAHKKWSITSVFDGHAVDRDDSFNAIGMTSNRFC